jgi:diguanylate cyclase (GGDEF)-like protein
MRNATLIALVTSLLLALVGISLAVSEHVQTRARLDQRLALQADGEANALGGLFARTRLALRLLAGDAAFRRGLPNTGTATQADMNEALGELERAEPGLVGSASAIGLDGRERARVVRGEPAPAAALSHDVRGNTFFRATLGTRPGGVHVSQPYRSADTGMWVVSNSALVRDAAGAPLGIVRFELPLASVRSAARAALSGERGVEVALVDRSGGREIFDTARGVVPGNEGLESVYGDLVAAGFDHGVASVAGNGVAYRVLTGVPLTLGWVVLAVSPQPSLFAAAGISAVVGILFAFSLALAAVGLISLRQHRRSEEQALNEAEGGRAEAERRSHTDALTGLYSRRHVVDAITAELARSDRTGVPPSVLMLDLDNFRRINTVYGHAIGDRVLSVVARRLQGRLRGYDVLGRWGGEKFIVLVPGVPDDATLLKLAEQIRRLVGQLPVAVDEETLLPVTVSVGAARAGDALRSVEGLIDCANRALAAAKRLGRDRVQLFGDLTVEDLVAEEPEPIRLARALSLSSSARTDLPQVDPERVSGLAAAIAEQLGLGEAETNRCRLGGLLHDVGTSSVPDRILALVGPPTARDRLTYEGHAKAGERLVRSVAGVSEVADVVGSHEECFDGTGYPAGLSGTAIPLESRIVACAIAYVKLAQVLDREAAARALERESGNALDSDIVAVTLMLVAQDGTGATSALRDVPTA